MARLITINGPLGVGKTWTVDRLREYLWPQGIVFQSVNFQEPLRKLCYDMLDVDPTFPYDLFKITPYYGVKGREWMIHLSESMKEKYPELWVHKAYNQLVTKPGVIYFADSQGFEIELDFLKQHADLGMIEFISASIEPPEYVSKRGEKYQADDSRFNLAHLCDIVQPDSNEMYWALKNKIIELGWAR